MTKLLETAGAWANSQFGYTSAEMSFNLCKSFLSRTQAGPGKTVKHEQEQIS